MSDESETQADEIEIESARISVYGGISTHEVGTATYEAEEYTHGLRIDREGPNLTLWGRVESQDSGSGVTMIGLTNEQALNLAEELISDLDLGVYEIRPSGVEFRDALKETLEDGC